MYIHIHIHTCTYVFIYISSPHQGSHRNVAGEYCLENQTQHMGLFQESPLKKNLISTRIKRATQETARGTQAPLLPVCHKHA